MVGRGGSEGASITRGRKSAREVAGVLQMYESDEARVSGYFQRLNQSGHDFKGQVSTAYGRAGMALSVAAKVDFGVLVCPGVHLDLAAALGGGRTGDTLVMIERHPQMLLDTALSRPPQTQDFSSDERLLPDIKWLTGTPLSLSTLAGRTWLWEVRAAADAWAGMTAPFGDETGIGVGVELKGSVNGTTTRLIDPSPRYYRPSAYDTTLADDVDDLFEENLKNSAAAWIAYNGGRLAVVRVMLATALDQHTTATGVVKGVAEVGRFAAAVTFSGLKAWKVLTIPKFDVDLEEVGGIAISAVTSTVQSFSKKFLAQTFTTEELLGHITSLETNYGSIMTAMDGMLASDDVSADIKTTAHVWRDMASRGVSEARDLHGALSRRALRKAARPSRWQRFKSATIGGGSPAPGRPRHHLDITTVESDVSAKAALKIMGALPLVDPFGLNASAQATGHVKRIGIRWQSEVPGRNQYGDAQGVRTTRDTIVKHWRTTLHAGAAANVGAHKAEAKTTGEWGSIGYRSVNIVWVDAGLPLLERNGSGISIGKSVLHSRLVPYARWCRRNRGSGTLDAQSRRRISDPDLAALERSIATELKVRRRELRWFMAGFSYDFGDLVPPDGTTRRKDGRLVLNPDAADQDAAVIIEAAFAFTNVNPVPLRGGRPTDLFEMEPVKKRLASGDGRAQGSSLRVIRARYRIQKHQDRSRSLLSIGYSPQLFADDQAAADEPDSAAPAPDDEPASWKRWTGFDIFEKPIKDLAELPVKFGGSLQRIRRGDAEGIFDLHVQRFPDSYDPAPPPIGYGPVEAARLTALHSDLIAELSVPPVVLFSQ